MKKIYLLIVLAITTKLSFGQNISDIKREGNSLYVYNEKGDYISQKSLQSDDELIGFSSTIIVIRSGNSLYVYNEKWDYISQKSLQSDDKVRNVSGNNIIIKSGNTIYTYDKKFDYISQRSDY